MTSPAWAKRRPGWAAAVLPLAALSLMLAVFLLGDPLAAFTAGAPPAEALAFEGVRLLPGQVQATLINAGPAPVTVAQVIVDGAYWQFHAHPSPVMPRLGRAVLTIPYPWVKAEPTTLSVLTSTGLTFETQIGAAASSPRPGWRTFGAYGLLGVYVGILPVALGLLWFPVMRRMGRRWLGAVLALTIGLLVFLLVDTLVEALEIARGLPGVFQGVALVLFSALITWLLLLAVAARRPGGAPADVVQRGVSLAWLIALGIGLHNLGEGLAIGAAFALGEAALGSFLVVGFTLHNVTEGIGIAAPLATPAAAEARSPRLAVFAGLALLAGAPAVLGAWIGGFAYSALWAALFLGIGAGAIWQVIVEVGRLLRGYSEQAGSPLASWANVGGFLLGLAVMYFTAFLVKV